VGGLLELWPGDLFSQKKNSAQTFQGYQIEQEKGLASDRYFVLQKKLALFL